MGGSGRGRSPRTGTLRHSGSTSNGADRPVLFTTSNDDGSSARPRSQIGSRRTMTTEPPRPIADDHREARDGFHPHSSHREGEPSPRGPVPGRRRTPAFADVLRTQGRTRPSGSTSNGAARRALCTRHRRSSFARSRRHGSGGSGSGRQVACDHGRRRSALPRTAWRTSRRSTTWPSSGSTGRSSRICWPRSRHTRHAGRR